jgi:putative flippase GtrA
MNGAPVILTNVDSNEENPLTAQWTYAMLSGPESHSPGSIETSGHRVPPEYQWPNGLVRDGKFLLVGLTGVVVNLGAFVLTVDSISHAPLSNFVSSILHFASKTAPNPLLYLMASAVAFGAATLWNFTLNSLWTFRTAAAHRHSPTRRLELYFGVSLGSLTVNEVLLFASEAVLPPLFGQAIGIIAGSMVGFIGNSRYTFAETRSP